MAALDRDELLANLSHLNDDDDATVAEAGRAAASLLAASGLDWPDVVLSPAALATLAATAVPDDAMAHAETPSAAKTSDDALLLIEHLLARDSLYEGTREDLVAYREDIAAGEFTDDDLAYLNALYARVVMGNVKPGG
jgi:hypothetical protein